MKHRAYVALGTNIEPKEKHLSKAIRQLREHPSIQMNQKSSIYETEPVGYTNQDYFLNMVVEIDTDLSPERLLSACQTIEQELGRKRIIKNGPRTIDLDILLFDDVHMEGEQLTIPHPRMKDRAFVLVPLAEINPDAPIDGVPVRSHLEKLDEEELAGVQKRAE